MNNFFNLHNVPDLILQGFRYFKTGILCSIALYGDLEYYRQTITYFRGISLNDIKTKPSTSFVLKIAGTLLYLRQMLLLRILRIIVPIKRIINYDI